MIAHEFTYIPYPRWRESACQKENVREDETTAEKDKIENEKKTKKRKTKNKRNGGESIVDCALLRGKTDPIAPASERLSARGRTKA